VLGWQSRKNGSGGHAFVVLAGLLGLVALAPDARADDPPPDLLAKILFKIATYDENLPHDDVAVAVVYPRRDTITGPRAFAALAAHQSMLVNGRRVIVLSTAYDRVERLESVLGTRPLYALFVAASTPTSDLKAIRTLAKARGILTFAQAPAHVGLGLTAGVRQDEHRREILLNVGVALEQRRRFDGAFLSACTIVRTQETP